MGKNGEIRIKSANQKLLIISLILVLLISMNDVVQAQGRAQCKRERRGLVNACKGVLAGKPPSAGCCRRVRATRLKCICSVITPQLAALIDVNDAVRVVNRCGQRLPRGYKCGSITLP